MIARNTKGIRSEEWGQFLVDQAQEISHKGDGKGQEDGANNKVGNQDGQQHIKDMIQQLVRNQAPIASFCLIPPQVDPLLWQLEQIMYHGFI